MNKIVKFINSINRKSLKYGSNSIILIAVVVAIAVLVNILVGMTSLKWDLTPNKLYSISDTTKDILKDLNKDVTIYGLFDEGKIGGDTDYKQVTELLGHYAKYPHVKIEYVDPDKNPGIFKDIDPDGMKEISKNDFIVKCGNKVKRLEYYDLFETEFDQNTFQTYKTGSNAEQGFTGAIKYVTSDKTSVIYFVEGHDEGSLDSDYQLVKGYLEKNNYDVKTLNLLTVDKIPEDAELLMLASPKKDLTGVERDRLKDYFKEGGKAIFMFDSLQTGTDLAEFNKLFADFNVSINNDKVKENDKSRHFPNNQYAILLDVDSNSVIDEDFNMVLANSRSINILKNQKEYITVTPLMKTSSKAVGEQIDKSKGADIQGPLNVAVSVEYKGTLKPSKLLVVGNGTFISDSAQQQYGPYFEQGVVFFLKSLSWMLDKKDEQIIAPKKFETPTLEITALQANVFGLILVIGLPVIILIAGLVVFLRRRHL